MLRRARREGEAKVFITAAEGVSGRVGVGGGGTVSGSSVNRWSKRSREKAFESEKLILFQKNRQVKRRTKGFVCNGDLVLSTEFLESVTGLPFDVVELLPSCLYFAFRDGMDDGKASVLLQLVKCLSMMEWMDSKSKQFLHHTIVKLRIASLFLLFAHVVSRKRRLGTAICFARLLKA